MRLLKDTYAVFAHPPSLGVDEPEIPEFGYQGSKPNVDLPPHGDFGEPNLELPPAPARVSPNGTINAALFPEYLPVADALGPVTDAAGRRLCVRVHLAPLIVPETIVNGPDPVVGDDYEEVELSASPTPLVP